VTGRAKAHLIAMLAVIIALSAIWWQFWALAILVFPVVALIYAVVTVARRVRARSRESAALVARADSQHQAVMRGDMDWGAFGWLPGGRPLPATVMQQGGWVIASWSAVVVTVMFAGLATCATAIKPQPLTPPAPLPPALTVTVEPPVSPAPAPIPFPQPPPPLPQITAPTF
jgi:hypothetical protein